MTAPGMSKGKLSALIVAGALAAVNADAAEIVTKCPRINDAGKKLTTQELQLNDISSRIVRWETRNSEPLPYFLPETKWTFWQAGMPPFVDVALSCTYDDGSAYSLPIVGWLLYCTAEKLGIDWPPPHLPTSCTSEGDPGSLRK